jgi:competence protein ComFC
MDLLDLVFPKKCVNCGAYGKYVCEKCEVGLWEEEQICPVCCRASRYGLRHGYCGKPWGMEGLTCLWAYEGVARKIIKISKYKFYFDILRELTSLSVDQLHREIIFEYFQQFMEHKPVVVPVPLWPGRERERGFNQAAMIGQLVASHWSLVVKNLLIRVRDTGRQVGRTREERLKAMDGAFKLNSQISISNLKSALLVDDVWTTGATMNECAKVLKQAGVRKVWGLVLAR